MLDSSKTILNMDEGSMFGEMEKLTTGNGNKEKCTEKASFTGPTAPYTGASMKMT